MRRALLFGETPTSELVGRIDYGLRIRKLRIVKRDPLKKCCVHEILKLFDLADSMVLRVRADHQMVDAVHDFDGRVEQVSF